MSVQTVEEIPWTDEEQIAHDLLVKSFKDLAEDFNNFSSHWLCPPFWDSPDNFSKTELEEIQEYITRLQTTLNDMMWRDGFMSAVKKI